MQQDSNHENKNTGSSVSFSGSIADTYEQILGDFLFEPYAIDLLQRINITANAAVLELAAGTGRVTKKLAKQLPAGVRITATDIEADMLNVAKQQVDAPNLDCAKVDMTNILFDDNQFDWIICQFGLMLVPDKLKALSEMFRVLKPGGQLIFSVWGDLNDNDIWRIGGEVLNATIGINPIAQDPGPFSMTDQTTLQWLKNTGFKKYKAINVKLTGNIVNAALAATGFINGLPVSLAIKKKSPDQFQQIEKALELELIKQLGNNPLQSPLSAWVFEAIK